MHIISNKNGPVVRWDAFMVVIFRGQCKHKLPVPGEWLSREDVMLGLLRNNPIFRENGRFYFSNGKLFCEIDDERTFIFHFCRNEILINDLIIKDGEHVTYESW